jgi:hypothetical protein
MTITRARRILGRIAETLTDKQIHETIECFSAIAKIAIDEAERIGLIDNESTLYAENGTHIKDRSSNGCTVNKSDPVEFPVQPLEHIREISVGT